MTLSRRGFLGALGITALGAASFGGLFLPGASGQTAQLLRSTARLPRPYAVPLPIPRVATPVRTDATTDYYEIVQREAAAEILPGLRTPIFGYDGTFPGPTLAGRSGRRMSVRHRNELPVPVAVHLHGGHTPADSDGFPIDLVLPASGWSTPSQHAGHSEPDTAEIHSGMTKVMYGDISDAQRDYIYPHDQRAATLWYHDHRMDFTAPQVWRGLAGIHLIGDDEDDALPLPKGERDIPLMICDRSFAEDGAFLYPALDPTLSSTPGVEESYMEGVLGDVILVNGAPWPELEVDAARYRFRIINASNSRRYRLELDPPPASGTAFVQVGSDGGLLEAPVSHPDLWIAAGERYDVVVDFSAYAPGTTVSLHNGLGEGGTARVMRFRVGGKVTDDSRIPDRLSTIEPLDPAKAVRTREWRFARGGSDQPLHWLINETAFDPRRMDANPALGEIEVWRFISDLHHPVHVHLDPFQVISRRGEEPKPQDAGWKDTVDLKPSEYVDVAVRFTDYTGAYMLHCHNLEHEDMAMMAAFETT